MTEARRAYQREYHRRARARRRQEGTCYRCGGDRERFSQCLFCRRKRQALRT